jgi:hypothetical protein
MCKSSLILAALFSFAVSAEANPYRIAGADGRGFGPVIGDGTMIVVAPDQTPVDVGVSPAGFLNSFPPNTSYPFLFLNDPTCSTQEYLVSGSLPAHGFVLLADQNEIFAPSATILYAKTPYDFVGSYHTYAVVYNDASSSYVCQAVSLPSSVPIGPLGSFSISHPGPFHAEPWSPQ